MYRKYKDGFYVNADRAITDKRKATKYIGRYLARAAIAEYRIESYDGESVTFWYEDHDSGEHIKVTLDVLTFIGKLVQQIHKKGFKCVRRYGLLRTKSNRERTYVQISMPQVRLRRMGTSICGR